MHGTNADVHLYNVSVPGYANSGFNAVSSIHMDDVDFGDADLWITPNGWGSSTVGPMGDDASMANVDAGDITMQRIHFGVFEDINAGDVSISGTTTHTETEVWKASFAPQSRVQPGSSCSSSAPSHRSTPRSRSSAEQLPLRPGPPSPSFYSVHRPRARCVRSGLSGVWGVHTQSPDCAVRVPF